MNPLQQFGLFFHDLFLGLFRMFATEWVAPLVAAIMIVVAIGLGVRAILEWSLGARRALFAPAFQFRTHAHVSGKHSIARAGSPPWKGAAGINDRDAPEAGQTSRPPPPIRAR